eukprot:23692-Chlamydomonas_euryale.AAC.6
MSACRRRVPSRLFSWQLAPSPRRPSEVVRPLGHHLSALAHRRARAPIRLAGAGGGGATWCGWMRVGSAAPEHGLSLPREGARSASAGARTSVAAVGTRDSDAHASCATARGAPALRTRADADIAY